MCDVPSLPQGPTTCHLQRSRHCGTWYWRGKMTETCPTCQSCSLPTLNPFPWTIPQTTEPLWSLGDQGHNKPSGGHSKPCRAPQDKVLLWDNFPLGEVGVEPSGPGVHFRHCRAPQEALPMANSPLGGVGEGVGGAQGARVGLDLCMTEPYREFHTAL